MATEANERVERRVGFGAHKLELSSDATRDERLRRTRTMLSRVLNIRTTIAFVGAGCSAPLGYPTWPKFATQMIEFTRQTLEYIASNVKVGTTCPEVETDLKRLKRLQLQIASGSVKETQYPFFLGVCKSVLQRWKAEKAYYKFLRRIFEPRKYPPDTTNPYKELLDLPIARFVTTNYDGEIEKALTRIRKVPGTTFRLHRKDATLQDEQRDFTQEPKYHNQLSLFAMARVAGADNMVFHCHGHYAHSKSMIVTEDDYQRWYLRADPTIGASFRQTIELLFGSNPILFVGYGLGDDDLLRSLRLLAAVDPRRKSSRPLFALLPEEEPGQDEDAHDFLYERFGVNVIPFHSPTREQRGTDLCGALQELKEDRDLWWKGWREKPVFRKVEMPVHPPVPYQHYPPIDNQREAFGNRRLEKTLHELKGFIREGAKVIVLIGHGGTGKSWYATRLMRSLQGGVPFFDLDGSALQFDGFFFWSSYYADDSLTGLDRVLAYLEPDVPPDLRVDGSRIQRFKACLKAKRYLLVFDGIERYLSENKNALEEGISSKPGVRELLEASMQSDSNSVVVLTTRLWPSALGSPEPLPFVKKYKVPLYSADDIEDEEPFSWIFRNQVRTLCAQLGGHIYGLVLAAGLLRQAGRAAESAGRDRDDAAKNRVSVLQSTLSERLSQWGRVSLIIEEAIKAVGTDSGGLAQELLQRVAVFMSPITTESMSKCFDLAVEAVLKSKATITDGGSKDALIEALVSSGLLQEVLLTAGKLDQSAYTVHPVVRGVVYTQIHHASTDALPNFTLPGFTASTALVHPGDKKAVRVVTDLIKRLCRESERAFREQRWADASTLCRSAFSVLRSRMEMNTVPRWSSYDKYFRILARLANLVKTISPDTWTDAQQDNRSEIENSNGPLYADEIAWIYNEIGLVCYAEGSMLDALAVWYQGRDINHIIDSLIEGGQYLFQSECNLGAVYINLGNLERAADHLREAERINSRLGDADHGARITGYLALIEHLRGNLPKADKLYSDARAKLRKLDEEAQGNPRAETIFLRHWSDLKIKLEQFDDAKQLILEALAIAQEADYPELLAYGHLTLGHYYRSQSQFPRAVEEYKRAVGDARRFGMRRLESEGLSELSRLAYDLGDFEVARSRAIESLRIANELLLGLRQSHDLVVLGAATIKTGQEALGQAYLRHAKRLAEHQKYYLRASEADNYLSGAR